jgi:hypothetical protein
MRAGQRKQVPALLAMACAGLFGAWVAPALAQGTPKNCCPPPCPLPTVPQTAEPPRPMPTTTELARPGETPRPATPSQQPEAQPPSTDLSLDQRFAGLGGETVSTPNMLGDFLGATALRCVPFQVTTQVPHTTTVRVPTPFCLESGFIVHMPINQPCPPGAVRIFANQTVTTSVPVTSTELSCYRIPAESHTFKISENESARPQDRVFVDYNGYFNVLPSERLGTDVRNMDVHRETLGIEKTFFDGQASIELRGPYNTLTVGGSAIPGSNGAFSDVGDVTALVKVVIAEDRQAGWLISGGLAVTVPTGPDALGGVSFTSGLVHTTLLQPYMGYLYNTDRWYVQGFSALDIPTASGDTLLMYNDVGVGYFLRRDRDSGRFLSAIVPTFEAHVTTPLSNAGTSTGLLFTPNVVDLTEGVILGLGRRATLSLGVAEPVTGPKPFEVEAIVQFNLWY